MCFVVAAEGDLESYAQVIDHLRTEYGYEAHLFIPPTRPNFLHDLYDSCALTPLRTIRRCNIYRSDGRTGSKIFSVPLVLEDERAEPPILEEPKVGGAKQINLDQ